MTMGYRITTRQVIRKRYSYINNDLVNGGMTRQQEAVGLTISNFTNIVLW